MYFKNDNKRVYGGKMDEVEWDVELLYTWSAMEKKPISEQQEEDYLARVRVLVVDQKKGNSEARRQAYQEIIGRMVKSNTMRG